MTTHERRAWIIVASLFVTLFLVFASGYSTVGVFFPYLLKQFKCTRAQLAMLPSIFTITLGLSAPLVGSVLDRFDARYIMTTGVILAGAAFLWASRVDSFAAMSAVYLLLGLGLGISCLVPCSVVVAKWFGSNRGVAMGLTFAGTSVGGTVMTLLTSYVAARNGWRAGYLMLAMPMILLVAPLIYFTVSTKDSEPAATSPAQRPATTVAGLTVSQAVWTRSFWLIVAAQACFTFVVTGMIVHLISYLLDNGYRQEPAALVMSLAFGFATLGKPLLGILADRLSARGALAICFAVEGLGLLFLFGLGQHAGLLTGFVPLFGLTFESPLVLLPLLIAESLGLRHYGSLSGVIFLFNAFGALLGPVVTGRIFDVTGSYTTALWLFVILMILGAVVSYACVPLELREARLRAAATAPVSSL